MTLMRYTRCCCQVGFLVYSMPIRYSGELATASFSGFHKLLLRWTGSIYKLLWKDILFYFICYYCISIVYNFGLSPAQQEEFRSLTSYFDARVCQIQIAFFFGFYLVNVANRFWDVCKLVQGVPVKVCMQLSISLMGYDEGSRLMRRTIVRYLCLGNVLTMRSISAPVRKRFPTIQHVVEAGFMTDNEREVFEKLHSRHNNFFAPFVWATSLVNQAHKEGRIKYNSAVNQLFIDINDSHFKCEMLLRYDYMFMPLIFTQLAVIVVFIWVITTLISRQYTGEIQTSGDYHFPFGTFLQYIFYQGSLKVCEQMLNPFGGDDDDVDLNGIIDGMLKGSYQIVDEMNGLQPELEKDMYWNQNMFQIPYTAASKQYQNEILAGTADSLIVPAAAMLFVISAPVKMLNKQNINPLITSHFGRADHEMTSRKTVR